MTDKYHKGTLPLPDTTFLIETLIDEKFVVLGELTITGKEVSDEMDAAQSIKGHEPHSIAERRARQLYPDYPIIIVTRKEVT